MKIVSILAVIVLSVLAINCGGDKPPQDPSTATDVDAAAPAPTSTETAPAPSSTTN